MPASLSLTNPLDALLLPRVLRWVAVVFRQKSKCGHLDAADGRPWSRIPAKDLAAQLEREEGLTVTVRRIQRSLERLVEEGHLARCQRTKWWGQRDFWYSWSDEEWALQQHRPTAVARSFSATVQRETKCPSEASEVTGQYLGIPLNTQTTLKAEQSVATSSLYGNGASVPPQVPSAGSNGQTPRSRGNRTLQTLQRTVQRAEARGFAPRNHSNGTVSGATEVKRWVQDGFVFAERPNGVVTKDPLATAPLR